MTTPNTWVLSYVRDREELYNLDIIQSFLAALTERNCHHTVDAELGFLVAWHKFIIGTGESSNVSQPRRRTAFDRALTPGSSNMLLKELNAYITERKDEFSFNVYSMARTDLLKGFMFSIKFHPGEGCILFSVDAERFFDDSVYGLAKYYYWLELIKGTYQCWHPLYIYQYEHNGAVPNPTWEETQAKNIHFLYNLNIFGPELVNKLGKERLLAAPAWKVEEFEDGGILISPENDYDYNPDEFDRESVAAYLELAAVHSVREEQDGEDIEKSQDGKGKAS